MERQYIAYVLIVALIGAVVGAIAYLRHNSRERVYRRRKLRERTAYKQATAGDDAG